SASFPLIVAEVLEQVKVAVFAGTIWPLMTAGACASPWAVSAGKTLAVTPVPRDAGTRAAGAPNAGRRPSSAMPCPPMPPGLFGYHHSCARVVDVVLAAETSNASCHPGSDGVMVAVPSVHSTRAISRFPRAEPCPPAPNHIGSTPLVPSRFWLT